MPRAWILAIAFVAAAGAALGSQAPDSSFTSRFDVEKSDLASTGRNPWFNLDPGHTLTLEDANTRLVITVLNETKVVDGVETRIVEERETEKGALIEVSRNYFAISRRTNSVFYFGEDVYMYKDGKVINHEGAWLSGVGGARFGLMMPGLPLMRARYFQEVAPKVVMDRAEIVSLTESIKTPAGVFTNVLKMEETTPLEPNAKEAKFYAAGIGLIQDGDLKLVSQVSVRK